jgi:hypothetical protein
VTSALGTGRAWGMLMPVWRADRRRLLRPPTPRLRLMHAHARRADLSPREATSYALGEHRAKKVEQTMMRLKRTSVVAVVELALAISLGSVAGATGLPARATVTVNIAQQYQRIAGFGVSEGFGPRGRAARPRSRRT